jgi:hypothetical protein
MSWIGARSRKVNYAGGALRLTMPGNRFIGLMSDPSHVYTEAAVRVQQDRRAAVGDFTGKYGAITMLVTENTPTGHFVFISQVRGVSFE